MLNSYIKYIKNNPKGYWFRAKWFGWGWTPATWQGWVVTAAFVVYLLLLSTIFPTKGEPSTETMILYLTGLSIGIVVLFSICYIKGEPPHWSWGRPKK